MKTVGIILGLGISIFMGISIYEYNYGDGNDWIHVLDRNGGASEIYDLSIVPDGIPKVYTNGDSVTWDSYKQSAMIHGDMHIKYAENDSSKAESILWVYVWSENK